MYLGIIIIPNLKMKTAKYDVLLMYEYKLLRPTLRCITHKKAIKPASKYRSQIRSDSLRCRYETGSLCPRKCLCSKYRAKHMNEIHAVELVNQQIISFVLNTFPCDVF